MDPTTGDGATAGDGATTGDGATAGDGEPTAVSSFVEHVRGSGSLALRARPPHPVRVAPGPRMPPGLHVGEPDPGALAGTVTRARVGRASGAQSRSLDARASLGP